MQRPARVNVGTRKSQLALAQTHSIIAALKKIAPATEFCVCEYSTTGDNVLDRALSKIGEKSLFTKELEVALLNHEVDFVVHSLKDLPTTLPEGLYISCMTEREIPSDVVIMSQTNRERGLSRLNDLPKGSIVGTSSVRRIAQLIKAFPHLCFSDIRGNLNTRFKKLDADDLKYDALILAYAGVKRLGLDARISSVLDRDVMLYAVGQGCIAIESLLNDSPITDLVASIGHPPTELQCKAERALMKGLEGGCSVALGVHSSHSADGDSAQLSITAGVFSKDAPSDHFLVLSKSVDIPNALSHQEQVAIAVQFGEQLAESMAQQGAKRILGRP